MSFTVLLRTAAMVADSFNLKLCACQHCQFDFSKVMCISSYYMPDIHVHEAQDSWPNHVVTAVAGYSHGYKWHLGEVNVMLQVLIAMIYWQM